MESSILYFTAAWLVSCDPAKTVAMMAGVTLEQMKAAMGVRMCVWLPPHSGAAACCGPRRDAYADYCVENVSDNGAVFTVMKVGTNWWVEMGPGIQPCKVPMA